MSKGAELRSYFTALFKRRWLVGSVALTLVLLTALHVYTATPLYTARTKLQIDPESSNILPYEDIYQSSLYFLATESYVRTQAQIMGSRALALRVVRKLDSAQEILTAPTSKGFFSDLRSQVSGRFRSFSSAPEAQVSQLAEASNEDLAEALLGGLTVTPVRGTRLMEITYTSPNPEFAADVVNLLAEEFIEQNLEKRFKAANKASEFLETQLVELQKRVEESEQRLIAYARVNDIHNVAGGENITLQDLIEVSKETNAVRFKLLSEAAQYEAVGNSEMSELPQSLKTANISLLENKLFSLQQELAKLAARFGPDWPEVAQLREEISTVTEQLNSEKKQAFAQIRLDYLTAFKHHSKLSETLTEQKARANKLFRDSIQYNIIRRETETNSKLYEGLLERLKQAGVSAGLRSSSIFVIDSAKIPDFASWPTKQRHLSIALFLGLILGAGLALMLEYIDNTIKTPEDVEFFVGLPTLAVIPNLEGRGRRRPFFKSPSQPNLLQRFLDVPKSQTWEAYRTLRTSLLLSRSGKPPRTVLVTSALPGEGKTTTSINTAIVLAQMGARTLLVDLDMRKPAISQIMGLDRSRGMSSYLSGTAGLPSEVQQTQVENLFALGGGPQPPNPAELIGSDRMRLGLSALKTFFAYIVVDSPPVLSVTDPLILAKEVDGVILVIHGGKVPAEMVRQASIRLEDVGARILGSTINNVDLRKSHYHYYYPYYDYSSSAQEQETLA